MSKILKVSESDYRIKVVSGGNITLDTGTNTGVVTITGNLVVQGDYTTINVQDMQIEDNIILLNKGESVSHAGITEGTSGLEIDRGSLDNAQFVWDESQGSGKFVIQTTNDAHTSTALAGIVVKDISTSAASTYLTFDMQSGPGVLHIANSTGYESRVTDSNDIPNLQYLFDYVAASGGVAVVDRIFSPAIGDVNTEVQTLTSSIKFYVRGGGSLNQRAQITNTGLDVDNINLYGNTVSNRTSNNLILSSYNSFVQVSGVLQLQDQGDQSATGGGTRVYSKSSVGPGKTGIYFTNNTTSDELVSKSRAVLLSILL
jgi:hypothetical protein